MMFSPPTGLNQRTDPGASADFFNTIRRFRTLAEVKCGGQVSRPTADLDATIISVAVCEVRVVPSRRTRSIRIARRRHPRPDRPGAINGPLHEPGCLCLLDEFVDV